jgi:hypothetical protein
MATTDEDMAVVITTTANDSDPDGSIDPTSVTITGGPSNGTAGVDPVTGNITYTPNANFYGNDTIYYSVCDDGTPVLCDQAMQVITVDPVNDPPVAVDDHVVSDEDTPAVIAALGNDFDIDGVLDLNTLSILNYPDNGSISIDFTTGVITYTPNPNFSGVDSVVYKICDDGTPVLCDQAVIYITVTPVNDPPVAMDDVATTDEDTPVVISSLSNDFDIDGMLDPSSVMISGGPSSGTASVDPATGNITYTPNPGFSGSDTIYYTVCDDGTPVLCDQAMIVITVDPVNDPPVAVDDTASVVAGNSVGIPVVLNDSDPDGSIDPTTVGIFGPPSGGTASVDPVTGQITYTPSAGFTGTDTIYYSVCDDGTPVLCDQAMVVVTVTGVNQGPVAVDDQATTDEDTPVVLATTANDYDNDGSIDPSTVVITGGPSNGTASVDPLTGNITYSPNPNFFGNDTIYYTVCDDGTPVLCDQAMQIITVNPVNDPPVAVNDAVSGPEDSPMVVNILANDSDPDGNILNGSVSIIGMPSNGMINYDPTTGNLTYTPNPNFSGSDTLWYVFCDGGVPALCDTAYVVFTVTPVNDAPVANNDVGSTNEDTPVNIDILSNDYDIDGTLDISSATVLSGPSNGTISIDPVTLRRLSMTRYIPRKTHRC